MDMVCSVIRCLLIPDDYFDACRSQNCPHFGGNMTLTESEFENEVRRIARALWPSAAYQGATIEDNRERDAVLLRTNVFILLNVLSQGNRTKPKKMWVSS